MQYDFHGLDNVQLALGVAEGLKASMPGGLNVAFTAGMARVGSLNNDGSLNVAQQGMNQPGKEVEVAAQTVAAGAAAGKYLFWLKTDKTIVAVFDPMSALPVPAESDPNDLAPELGNDPFKGEMIDGRVPGGSGQTKLQRGPLRRQEAASVLLCVATVAGGAVTEVNNLVRRQILL